VQVNQWVTEPVDNRKRPVTYQLKLRVNNGERAGALRARRLAAGLTQREVAARADITQPNLAAYEAGRRALSDQLYNRIIRAMRTRPSVALRQHADEVKAIARRHGALDVSVFGSVARGDDRYDSDIDLLLSFRPGTGLFAVVDLTEELEKLLGTEVDIVSMGGLTERDDHIREEAVAL
jgi:predicted nucleotidyltransferase